MARLGGDGVIHSAAFSPDGSRIVTASFDKTARIWDAVTAKEIAVLRGHDEYVTSAAFSPDGRTVVTASADGTARIWDAATGKLLRAVRVNARPGLTGPDPVFPAAFSPDGRTVVTASQDGTAHIWEAATGKLLRAMRVNPGLEPVYSAAFRPDGKTFVTASADGTARIWDAATGNLSLTLSGNTGPVYSAAFSSDGTTIVTASQGGTARIWDAATGNLSLTLSGNTDPVYSAAFSPDGLTIVTASADNAAHLWRVRFGSKSPTPLVQAIASTASGSMWVVGKGGYAAYSEDGRSWTGKRLTSDDLIAVAAAGPNHAVALTAKNALVFLSTPTQDSIGSEQSRRPTDPIQQPQQELRQGQQPSKDGSPHAAGIDISLTGQSHLQALYFQDGSKGWVAGTDGVILVTSDSGQHWTKIYERNGLTLADLYVEPTGVGWAVGQRGQGQEVLVAANKANQAQNAGGWREMPTYLGRWYFLVGIPGLVFAGFLNLLAWRPEPPRPTDSIEEVATSDEPLSWNDPDGRNQQIVARGLSRVLRNVNTKPPLTLAVTGRWGSGKSSLMRLLMSNLRQYGGRAVWFNAWHHTDEDDLLAALFEAIRREGPPAWWSWPGLVFRARLFWIRSKRSVLNLCYLALFAGIAIVTFHIDLPGVHSEDIAEMIRGAAELLGKKVSPTWQAVGMALAGSGSVALITLWLRGKLVALPANPAKLAAALARRASLGDFSDKLSFRHRFGEQFEDACNALLTRTSPGLVVLIDDLDRCQPPDVQKILEAVNYLSSAGPCTIVLGMDRRQVEYCVGLGFKKLVEGLPDDELIYAREETSDKAGKQRAYARHYLEKLINIEVPVPALDDIATDALLLRGTTGETPDDVNGPAWLQTTKQVCTAGFQVARVGLLAFVVGILLTAGFDMWREPHLTHPTPSATPGAFTEKTTNSIQPTSGVAQGQESPLSFEPAKVELLPLPQTQELPISQRWPWWSATVLFIGVAVLFGIAAALYRERQVLRDSADFATALRWVKPLFIAIKASPRAIKRYQNRMRYLAAHLRPQFYEPDRFDTLLHWLGKRLGRQFVPPKWFEQNQQHEIREPALILLGAIELFAPNAFANPGELFVSLEHTTPGDVRSIDRTGAWSRVRDAFADKEWMPTAAEVARYATFVLVRERRLPTQPADVVAFARDPRSA
jgi:hypothetical protein